MCSRSSFVDNSNVSGKKNKKQQQQQKITVIRTLVLLIQDLPWLAISEDPDQMASLEAIWSGSSLFAI